MVEIKSKYDNGVILLETQNSIKKMLNNADSRNADLRYANLRDANLKGSGLRYADLRYADLRSTDLRKADLRNADLRYADLRYANLRGANLADTDLKYADLRDADLRDANLTNADLVDTDLRDVIGDGNEIVSMQIEKYKISYNKKQKILNIGCQTHSLEKWKKFKDSKIKTMDNGALEWWKNHKKLVMLFCGEKQC